jgi:PEP-CTERM motif
MKLSLFSVAACALFITGMAMSPASAIIIDFESGTGYDLFNGAALSTDQSLSPTHSAQLNDPVNGSLVRIRPVEDYGLNLKLGTTSESFAAFIPSGSDNTLAPYGMFGVDVDGNGIWDGGTNDALVIAFITGASSYPTDTWFTTGLDANTNVHVVGNRAGLGAGDFSSSNGGGLLSALDATSTGSELWGDLGLLRVYVEIGSWPGVDTYNSYIDNLTVTSVSEVPEPLTLSLFGAGAVGAAALRRRKKAQKA